MRIAAPWRRNARGISIIRSSCLPPEKKNAMCAIYAFMRYCDDLSDEPGATRTAMDRWREALTDALAGHPDDNPAWPAFLDSVERYAIPHEYFYEMIEGVASDLEPRTIATFDELYRYCYRVASVVGLTTIHIFGFHRPKREKPRFRWRRNAALLSS